MNVNVEDLLADEEFYDLINYYNNHHGNHQANGTSNAHHGNGVGAGSYFTNSAPSSPFLQNSSPMVVASSSNNASAQSASHHQQLTTTASNSQNVIDVVIQTAIDDQFLQQWSNYDLKKEDEMYEKYNVALKITNNTNKETPPLLLNCRHEIHDKGNICEMLNRKNKVNGYYLDFLLFEGKHFTLKPNEERIILTSISRPSRTMVSHGKYYIQFFVITSGDFQSLCQTQQVKVLTSKNKNNRTKKVSLDPTKQDISVKNLVPKEWQSLQTSHQVFESCFWEDIDLTGEKMKYTPPATVVTSSSNNKTVISHSPTTTATTTTNTPPNNNIIQQQLPAINNEIPPSPPFFKSSPSPGYGEQEVYIQNFIPINTHISIIKIFQKQLDFYKQQMEILLTELKRHDKRMAETLYRQYATILKRDLVSNSPWEEESSNLPSEEDLEDMFTKMKIIKEQVEQSINDSKKPPCSPVSHHSYGTPSPSYHSVENSNFSLYNPRDYDFSFEDDVTIPDFSEVKCGSVFLKTWKISNCGLTIPSGTRIVVKSDKETPLEYGEILLPLANTDENRVLTEQELPHYGETKNVSISIKAPPIEALFRREYCLQLPNGIEFGDNLVVIFKTVK
ncbi:predicted protein [Naegleria gruberi]|uniref:Predicted protein n=1 Tax=Naegleria gruberi TaxID=5762 RepID=D2VQI1_NAEGR|nr:uncharacterized protein NAEGRDRAFT_51463 [Naegleria gruberi]EFC40953.1 predicted protein [Naegleria gruberi]|eukprot:XP_002673697.1 predicted protein [Naegleria gruberi strain NEG-M]